MNLKNIDYKDWTSQWASPESILAFSYYGNFYCRKPFSKDVDRYVDQAIIITRQGKSWAYQRSSVKKICGKKLENLIKKNPNFPQKFCSELKSAAGNFLKIVDKYFGKDIDFNEYNEFQTALLERYYPYHIEIKIMADFLKPELLKKYWKKFKEARIHAEPIFKMAEEFMNTLAKIHSKKTGYPPYLILATVKDEFHKYFKGEAKLPSKKILEERYKASAFIFTEKETEIITGNKVDKVERVVRRIGKDEERGIVKGNIAYPGIIQGRVKLVLDAMKAKNFKEGNILVAAMTRPIYLPLLKKAAAFVTDGGGLLCHAAILARELKKPCIIGTEVATKVLKDGDLVEVDTKKERVKILKRK